MIGISQDDLAQASGVAKATIATFESGKRTPYERTLRDIRSALEQAGVQLLATGDVARGEGVVLATPKAPAASQASMDASADDVRSQAADAADRAMDGMDASQAEKTSRRKRLTDAPDGTKNAVKNDRANDEGSE
ncbi:hypothetical protein GCM10019059_06400 [Camelimonas fluminis]|uniref:Helix-turn-helix domain-containing protein n=1 Tax=Camelimonas fluminis TaxID=1576911 RepID=A0ABV7UGZ6_9HYPH|nr:hypothetical protein GCM10019059_06400 [Camelimonas fluminis]